MRDLLALIRMRTFSAVLPNSGSDSMLTEPPAAQGEQNAIRVMRFKGFEKVARPILIRAVIIDHLPADLLDQARQILLALLELRPRFIIADAAAPLSPFPAGKNMAP